MKNILILIIVFIGIFSAFNAKAGIIIKPVFNAGLVGYWSFQEGAGTTANDKSGNGNTGTLTNMAENDWVDGKIGKALDFDGTDDFVSTSSPFMPTAKGFRTTGLTISAWHKGTNTLGSVAIQQYDNYDWGAYGLFLSSGYAKMSAYSSGVNYRQADSNNTINDNTWHHIVGVVDNSTDKVILYVDGVKQTDTDVWLDTDDYEADADGYPFYRNFAIGARERTIMDNLITGTIDEVRIYNRALSDGEVQRLYKLSQPKILAPTKTGLVGYWSFEEGTGTNVGDMSGNGNNGTINGAVPAIGKLGQALDFEKNESDSVTIPDSTSLEDITNMTVSVWFKAESFSGDWDLLVGKGVGAYWWVGMHNDDFSYGPPDLDITADLSTNIWYHAVFVFDDTNNRSLIYKDGNVVDDRLYTESIPDTTGDVFYIGRSQYGEYFDGIIDEVRIYNRALETSEIQALYKSGLAKINASQNNQLTDGLVGLWSFNGSDVDGNEAYDRSGNGNTGTITGATKTIGKVGQALDFEGSESDDVTVPDSSSLENITDMTVSVWFKAESLYDWNLLVGKGVGAYWWVGMHNDDFSYGPPDLDITADLSTNIWYHAVFVFDDTNNRSLIYKDGNVVDDRLYTESIPDTTGDVFYIGRSQYGEYFDGIIDEVRIYNRALSAQEVLRLYNLGR